MAVRWPKNVKTRLPYPYLAPYNTREKGQHRRISADPKNRNVQHTKMRYDTFIYWLWFFPRFTRPIRVVCEPSSLAIFRTWWKWLNLPIRHNLTTEIFNKGHTFWLVFAVCMLWVLHYRQSAQRGLVRLCGCGGWSVSLLSMHHLSKVTRKHVFGDLRPGKTQTGLPSYISQLVLKFRI